MRSSSLAATLFALVVAAPSLAAESAPAGDPPTETPTVAATTAPARPAAVRPSPLTLAMNGILEGEKAAMTKLKARFAAARDAASMQAIHREIEQLKLDTEVQLLTVQATDHRKHGRVAVAEQLEEAIRELRAPLRTLEPAARPAPVAPAPTAR